jgi:hypothetical protein
MKNRITFFLLLFFYSCNAQNKSENLITQGEKIVKNRGLEIGFILVNRFIISGNIDSVFSNYEKEISYFNLYDCKTEKYIDLLCSEKVNEFFCLPSTVMVNVTKSCIKIIHIEKLPYGKNWELINVPIFEQTFSIKNDSICRDSAKCILYSKKISNKQKEEVIGLFNEIKNKNKKEYDVTDPIAELIEKLFVCSINNYSDCKEIFLNLEKYLPGSTEGYITEVYSRWLGIYFLYSNRNYSF